MKRRVFIAVTILLVVVGVGFLIFRGQGDDPITADAIHEPSEGTGFIAEKVIGNPDEAKVIVYEYADYGCLHCAEWNRRINELIDKYGDKLVLVFRGYNIGQFNNASIAFKAATAAQLQGYFKEYKDYLFNNQSEWEYTGTDQIEDVLVGYFEKISEGKGDKDKFRNDLKSDAVRKRVNFEQRMGKQINLKGTPTFRIDGETVELSKLVETIEQKME